MKKQPDGGCPMFGVTIAIILSDQILLVKREDYHVWCLPGGKIDTNETVIAAARREALEETGIIIEPIGLVGIYSMPCWTNGLHSILIRAKPIGGKIIKRSKEVVDAGYYRVDKLPTPMMRWHLPYIHDSMQHKTGLCIRQDAESLWDLQDLYESRDRSSLTRNRFFTLAFGNGSNYQNEIESSTNWYLL